jgi:hypothetical protein
MTGAKSPRLPNPPTTRFAGTTQPCGAGGPLTSSPGGQRSRSALGVGAASSRQRYTASALAYRSQQPPVTGCDGLAATEWPGAGDVGGLKEAPEGHSIAPAEIRL